MNQIEILTDLEALGRRVGIIIRYEPLSCGDIEISSGRCRVHGQDYLFVDRRMSEPKRMELICQELARTDLRNVFMKPYLRELLAGFSPESG